MLLDYNENENSLLYDIAVRYNSDVNEIRAQYMAAKDTGDNDEIKRTQSEYSKLLSDYGDERKAIEHRAETRETKYFSTHTKELAERLQIEIEMQIVSFGVLQNHADFQAVYQNDVEIKKRLTDTFGRYLDILQKYDAESYQSIISFIDNAIDTKEEITQTFKTRLKELPKESNQGKNIWDKPYPLMLQNNLTNIFNKVARLNSTRGTLETWAEQATYKQDNLTIIIPNYEALVGNSILGKDGEISTPAKKVLDILTILFTESGHNPAISFSVDTYMKLCGLSDKRKAREQINNALEALFNFTVSYNGYEVRIIDAMPTKKTIRKGIVHTCFSLAYAKMLCDKSQCSPMPYPISILQASKGTKNRNAFFLARRIAEHFFMNSGQINERKIAIRTLLKAAPFLATEEEVRNSDRRLTDRITKPFMNDLEEALIALSIGSEGYELHYAGGAEIPSGELETLPYEVFIEAYVWFDTLPNYPSQATRIESRKKFKQAALEVSKEKKTNKKRKT